MVSTLEILSTNPIPLKPKPLPPVSSPRLSPLPAGIPGVSLLCLSLGGTWRFHPSPEKEFWKKKKGEGPGWKPIQVPGEWTMQGFRVKPGTAAAYRRTFRIPPSWEGLRVKLRCDGVYSKAEVYLNGRPAGSHTGGFTPFELDVTDLVRTGGNEISLAVTNESIQDTLSCGSQYAAHQLGGITRRIRLFPLPSLNVASFHAFPFFEKNGRDARLELKVRTAAEGDPPAGKKKIHFRILGPLPGEKTILFSEYFLSELEKGASSTAEFVLHVPSPEKWDPEHPRLYRLEASLLAGETLLETTFRRIGFREIRIEGNRFLVNGVAVKLRGADRHEIDPLRGRSLAPGDWRLDALLFKKANVNYIRTSHYPPDEAFLDACDEIGLFVEEEAPLCWVGHGAAPVWRKWNPWDRKFYPHLVKPILEMIERDADHPSVILWSLANESAWTPNFARAFQEARGKDPSRPFTFHDQCWGSFNNHGSRTQVGNFHYPGPGGPDRAAREDRPILFGEYCHVSDYDRSEIAADPGVRDIWGEGLHRMWEKILSVQACLGGAIWAGIDDIFLLPSGEVKGYGPWGLLDMWRRPKPEYWNAKKTYSPVKILTKRIPPGSRPIRLEVLNRHIFSDLSEGSFQWKLAPRGKGVLRASLPPGAHGWIDIDPGGPPREGDALEIRFFGPQGFLEDVYRIPVGRPSTKLPFPLPGEELPPVRVFGSKGSITVEGKDFRLSFDKGSGLLKEARRDGKPILTGGPFLVILPLKGGPCRPDFTKDITPFNELLPGWKALSVQASRSGKAAMVQVKGRYPGAEGSFTITISPSGRMTVQYDFVVKKKVNPRQWGAAFRLAGDCAVLSWRRKSLWSWYPPDHIGRTAGEAQALPPGARVDPWARRHPKHPWSLDANQLGTRDFRSTKKDVYWAALRAPSGEGILVNGGGKRSVRAWLGEGRPFLLFAGFTTMGSEGFFASHVRGERRPLAPGDHVLRNVPDLVDVRTTLKLLDVLGADSEMRRGKLRLSTQDLCCFEAPYDLVRTMRAIVEKQIDWFRSGKETDLKPVILNDIAEMIEMDISTISRVTKEKYVQTPYGVYELKYFFNDRMATSNGEEVATRTIKAKLREIIENEDKAKPLSDQAIADLLKQEGFPIARRTVQKYRVQHFATCRRQAEADIRDTQQGVCFGIGNNAEGFACSLGMYNNTSGIAVGNNNTIDENVCRSNISLLSDTYHSPIVIFDLGKSCYINFQHTINP